MAKCYHINTTRLNKLIQYLLRIHTSKISSGRLFLVAASPYASKYGGLRINSTNPAHKKHIASRKCKTCIPPENLSLHVLSRKQNGKATIDGMTERFFLDHWKVYVLVFSVRTSTWFPDQLQEGDLQQPYTLSCVMNTNVSLDRKCGEPPRNYNINRR